MREVRIVDAMNGYVVTVGCQTLVFETRERMLAELTRYLADPEGVEREYNERYRPTQNAAGCETGQTATPQYHHHHAANLARERERAAGRYEDPSVRVPPISGGLLGGTSAGK